MIKVVIVVVTEKSKATGGEIYQYKRQFEIIGPKGAELSMSDEKTFEAKTRLIG